MNTTEQAKRQGEWWAFFRTLLGFPEEEADGLYDDFCGGMESVLSEQRRTAKAKAKASESAEAA